MGSKFTLIVAPTVCIFIYLAEIHKFGICKADNRLSMTAIQYIHNNIHTFNLKVMAIKPLHLVLSYYQQET